MFGSLMYIRVITNNNGKIAITQFRKISGIVQIFITIYTHTSYYKFCK